MSARRGAGAARATLALGLLVSLAGCSGPLHVSAARRHALDHAIFVRADGEPASLVDERGRALFPADSLGGAADGEPSRAARARASGFERARDTLRHVVTPSPRAVNYDYGRYVDRLLANLRSERGADTVVLFIHGGRNPLAGALKNTVKVADSLAGSHRYPICVDYETADLSSYGEHLTWARPDRRSAFERGWMALGVPLRVVSDVGRAVVRVPLTLHQEISREYTAWRYVRGRFPIPTGSTDSLAGLRWRLGEYREGGATSTAIALGLPVAIPLRTVWNTTVTAFGPGEWESMRRRSTAMFDPEWSYALAGRMRAPRAPQGALALLVDGLVAWQAEDPRRDVILVSHSTGSIVACELLARYPQLRCSELVFMGSACTVREFLGKAVPWMQRPEHAGARCTILALHPALELRETFGPRWTPFFYRGSLLVWLDDFLAPTGGVLDRTLGRFDNVVAASGQFPPGVRERLFVRGFGNREREPGRLVPTWHSAFAMAETRWWEGSAWTTADADRVGGR